MNEEQLFRQKYGLGQNVDLSSNRAWQMRQANNPGQDVNSASFLLKNYLTSIGKSEGSKEGADFIKSLGLNVTGNSGKAWGNIYSQLDTNQTLGNSILSKIGLGTSEQIEAFKRGSFGPASGVTAQMRATNPNVAQAIYQKIDPNAGPNVTGATQNLNVPPVVAPSIPSGNLTGGTGNLNVPGGGASTTQDFMAGMTAASNAAAVNAASGAAIAAGDQAALQKLQTERTSGTDKLMAAFNNLTGKATETENLSNKAGIPQLQKQLGDINMQIAQKTAAYNQGLLDIEGKPIPMEFITGQQAQVKKQAALDIGALTAVAQVLQGNISAAKDTVEQTVKLEWEDRLNELNRAKTFLDLNEAEMSKAEKKIAEVQKAKIDAEKQAINDFQDLKKIAINAAFDAGADQATVQSLFSSKNSTQLTQYTKSIPTSTAKSKSGLTSSENQLIDAYINGGKSSKSVEADKFDIIKAVGSGGYNKILNAIKIREGSQVDTTPFSLTGTGSVGPLSNTPPNFLQRVKNFFTGASKTSTASTSTNSTYGNGKISFEDL